MPASSQPKPSLLLPGKLQPHLSPILLLLTNAHLCSSISFMCFNVTRRHSEPAHSLASLPIPSWLSWNNAQFLETLFPLQSHTPHTCWADPSGPLSDCDSVPSALACPANTIYQSCMTPCPASCANLVAPRDCEGPCVEGCASLPGYVYSGAQSLPLALCGCTNNGIYYQVRGVWEALGGGGVAAGR